MQIKKWSFPHYSDVKCGAENSLLEDLSHAADSGVRSHSGWSSSYLLYVPVVSGLLALFLYCLVTQTPLSTFTRDPLDVAKGMPYYGFVSNIGILFWCGTSAICFFAWIIKRNSRQNGSQFFLFCSACLTMLLLLDDLFMLHENVYPQMLGIRQRYVVLTYMLLTLAYIVRFRKIIFTRHAPKLLAAFGFFVISLAADVFPVSSDQWQYLFEDGAKLMGVVSWFNYFIHVCREEILEQGVPETS